MQTFRQQETIFEAGQACTSFYIIVDGTVSAIKGRHAFNLGKGDIVGIFDLTCQTRLCTYIASSAVTLAPYNYNTQDGLFAMFEAQPDLGRLILNSLNNHICDIFEMFSTQYTHSQELYQYVKSVKTRYQSTCSVMHYTPKALPFFEELDSITIDNNLGFWATDFYKGLRSILSSTSVAITPACTFGFLSKMVADIEAALANVEELEDKSTLLSSYLLNEDYIDLYGIYMDLYTRVNSNGDDTLALSGLLTAMADQIKASEFIDKTLIENRLVDIKLQADYVPESGQNGVDRAIMQAKLADSIGEILDFSEVDSTIAAEFKKAIGQFKALPDKEATDSDTSALRKQLTALFNTIYSETVQIAVTRDEMPAAVKMFINFGFVDMGLCGEDNAIALYNLCDSYRGREDQGIYTALEWFKAIYEGKKQPSRNEFDMDFNQHVRQLVKEGKITKSEETKLLQDNKEKLQFELCNMFPTVNKITFGRIFTFCPVLLEGNIIKNVGDMMLTPKKILDVFAKYNAIDYSAFYHEYIYEDIRAGVKDTVRMDIKPDFILMPNVGSRGVLWQEIEGSNRKTPGRMILSAFFVENLEKAILRMFGEFRWEMCKREMGSRWNDVTSHSLTSDYCDYAQFFQKNRDLSVEAKEKLKETLKKCKNSHKEMFVYDYIQFITYESMGSARLNKVARSILFQYCPFGKDNRAIAGKNSIFDDCLSKHRVQTGQSLHRLDIIESKYKNYGKELPDELKTQRELLER